MSRINGTGMGIDETLGMEMGRNGNHPMGMGMGMALISMGINYRGRMQYLSYVIVTYLL